jgi:translation initiation factor 1
MRNTRLVYSTEQGRVGKTEARPASLSPVPKDGILRIFRERAGHGGKTVTVIRGLPLRGAALDALAAELRRLCGAGGAVKDDAIELQGDHRDRLAARLGELGYRVKLAGG